MQPMAPTILAISSDLWFVVALSPVLLVALVLWFWLRRSVRSLQDGTFYTKDMTDEERREFEDEKAESDRRGALMRKAGVTTWAEYQRLQGQPEETQRDG
jgi:hypothetical protein